MFLFLSLSAFYCKCECSTSSYHCTALFDNMLKYKYYFSTSSPLSYFPCSIPFDKFQPIWYLGYMIPAAALKYQNGRICNDTWMTNDAPHEMYFSLHNVFSLYFRIEGEDLLEGSQGIFRHTRVISKVHSRSNGAQDECVPVGPILHPNRICFL